MKKKNKRNKLGYWYYRLEMFQVIRKLIQRLFGKKQKQTKIQKEELSKCAEM